MNKRWQLFFSVGLVLIFSLSLYLAHQAKETESKLRIKKELELSDKMVELTEKQAAIAELSKQKEELELELKGKVGEMESLLKENDSTIRSQSEKLDSLVEENEILKKDVEIKEKKLIELTRKIQQIETDKADLLAKLKKLETKAEGDEGTEPAAAESTPYGILPRYMPESDTVQLGKIVVQRSSGRPVSVQQVNLVYGFIVLNAGSDEGLFKDTVVNIVRGKKLIGKAVVEKTRPSVSVAVILPEWSRGDIKAGDVISRF